MLANFVKINISNIFFLVYFYYHIDDVCEQIIISIMTMNNQSNYFSPKFFKTVLDEIRTNESNCKQEKNLRDQIETIRIKKIKIT